MLKPRRNDGVVIEGAWVAGVVRRRSGVGAAVDFGPSRSGSAPPVDIESVMSWAEVQELGQCRPRQSFRWLHDHGVDVEAARVLSKISAYSGQRVELVIHQRQGITTFLLGLRERCWHLTRRRRVSALHRQEQSTVYGILPGHIYAVSRRDSRFGRTDADQELVRYAASTAP